MSRDARPSSSNVPPTSGPPIWPIRPEHGLAESLRLQQARQGRGGDRTMETGGQPGCAHVWTNVDMGADAKAAFDLAFSLNTAAELRQLAAGAGLTDIRVRFTHRTMRHAAPAFLVAGFAATTPIAGQFLGMPEDRRRAFVGSVLERLSSYIDDDGLAVPQENHYLTALKPA
jgi:hypothetical protein